MCVRLETVFTTRCTLVQSALLRLHVVRLSICPSKGHPHSLLPGEHGEILGRLEVGWEKAAISLKHVKIEEKLLQRAYRSSPTLFRTVPSPTYGNPHPKIQLLLSQKRVKLQTSYLASIFTVSIRTKAHEKFWRKGRMGISRDCPNF